MHQTPTQSGPRCLPLALFLLIALASSLTAQQWKVVRPGVEYVQVTKEIAGLNVNMNLLRLDLTKVRVDVIHANDAIIGTELTSSMASRKKAIAAINAGFFRLDTSQWLGDPAGILQIDGKLLSEPINDRIELLINNGKTRTDVYVARPTFTTAVKFGNEQLELKGINRELKADDVVMYTSEFGKTTLTGPDAYEVVVANAQIAYVTTPGFDHGNSPIPTGGFVVSASGTFKEKLSKLIASNPKVMLVRTAVGLPPQAKNLLTPPNDWDIVAGVPQLIHDGRVDITWQQEKSTKSFVETRHPRTAVARLKDGKFLMMTVDGRSESSGGIALQDLADYLLSLGAVDAMNLDGGGSTTMWLNGTVVNHPSDKEGERKVSDALIVTSRRR